MKSQWRNDPFAVTNLIGSPGRYRSKVRVLALLGAAVAFLSLILVSPLFLGVLAGLSGVSDWNRLSAVGQTYGAASAVLSALALGGVAVSLFFQASQARAQQIQMVREYQRELLRMTLENPELYMPCWRPIEAPGLDVDGRRQHLFMTLRMNYAYMGYEVGIINEASLRLDVLTGAFKGQVGREYWHEARRLWILRGRRNRRTRQFVRIVEEEYDNAVTKGPPTLGRRINNTSQNTSTGYL